MTADSTGCARRAAACLSVLALCATLPAPAAFVASLTMRGVFDRTGRLLPGLRRTP